MAASALETKLLEQIQERALPDPQPQYRFHPTRRWQADFAWPELGLLVECDGGTWVNGRHGRGLGARKDYEKLNAAEAMGYHVFRYTTDMVKDGTAIRDLQQLLAIPSHGGE